jgi:hypothetical protein
VPRGRDRRAPPDRQDLEDTDTGLSGTGNLLVLVPNYLTETNDVYYVELGATLEFGVYQKEEL